VADLAVAHVVVARQPDGGAVRAELERERALRECVEVGRAREENGVGLVFTADADDHDDDDRATHAGIGGMGESSSGCLDTGRRIAPARARVVRDARGSTWTRRASPSPC
jgi:hypothetical protein